MTAVCTQPESIREAFLSAIEANPDDTQQPLIYADWLDEHGETALAVLIRAAIEGQGHGVCEAAARLAKVPAQVIIEETPGIPRCPSIHRYNCLAGTGGQDGRAAVRLASEVHAWLSKHADAVRIQAEREAERLRELRKSWEQEAAERKERERRQRRFAKVVGKPVRAACKQGGKPYPIEIINGDSAPKLVGEESHHTNKGGERIDYPNAYRRKFGNPIYQPSTLRIQVGRGWLAAQGIIWKEES